MKPLWIRLPDEARSLPPPPLFNKGSVWMGFLGWIAAMCDNALNQRPILKTGVHRQLLFVSAFFYVGNYLNKRGQYMFAKRDRDVSEYARHHPEDFKEPEKRTMAEVLEAFHPVR